MISNPFLFFFFFFFWGGGGGGWGVLIMIEMIVVQYTLSYVGGSLNLGSL